MMKLKTYPATAGTKYEYRAIKIAQPIELPNLLPAFSDSSANVFCVGRIKIRQKVPSQSFKVSDNSMSISESLTTQPLILELIFRIGCEEIEAITLAVEPVIIGRRAASCNPVGISGLDVEDNFREQAVTAREDGHAVNLIFLNATLRDEAIHRFIEDGIGDGFQRVRLNLIRPNRAEDGRVGGGARWDRCRRS